MEESQYSKLEILKIGEKMIEDFLLRESGYNCEITTVQKMRIRQVIAAFNKII